MYSRISITVTLGTDRRPTLIACFTVLLPAPYCLWLQIIVELREPLPPSLSNQTLHPPDTCLFYSLLPSPSGSRFRCCSPPLNSLHLPAIHKPSRLDRRSKSSTASQPYVSKLNSGTSVSRLCQVSRQPVIPSTHIVQPTDSNSRLIFFIDCYLIYHQPHQCKAFPSTTDIYFVNSINNQRNLLQTTKHQPRH